MLRDERRNLGTQRMEKRLGVVTPETLDAISLAARGYRNPHVSTGTEEPLARSSFVDVRTDVETDCGRVIATDTLPDADEHQTWRGVVRIVHRRLPGVVKEVIRLPPTEAFAWNASALEHGAGRQGLHRRVSRLSQATETPSRQALGVDGMAHTNGLDSFWSLLKRSHRGTYHKMSRKHLGRYVNGFQGRHNFRTEDTAVQMSRWPAG